MQPDSHDDLDRTDELPRLDVAAYEATLDDAGTDPLSRTDTWAVGALQGLELPADDDEQQPEPPTRLRPQKPVIAGSADLSINVDRLLKRITELETNLATSRAASDDLERRNKLLDGAHAELEQRLNSVQAENAKLIEQSSLSQDQVRRLEQQLQDQLGQHDTWLNETAATREADRLDFERTRVALEQQLERNTAHFTELDTGQANLRAELNQASELAASRAAQIEELQRTLTEEEDTAHALGRNLASKLADYEILSAMATQRNATIVSLQQVRDGLQGELERSVARADSLALQLTDTEQRVAAKELQSGERDREIEKRDQQLRQLNAQIERLTADLQATSLERDSGRETLALEKQQQDRSQAALAARAQEISTLRDSLNSAEARANTLQTDLEAAASLRDDLATRTAELESTSAELATVRHESAEIWTELENQSNLASTREAELAAASQSLAELQRARDELHLALEEANGKINKLYAVSRDDTELLTAKNAELAALKRHLEEQAPLIRSLEQSIHARDTLVEDLRNEIRTVQDERAIMAGQLDKARLRVKSMAQQIFDKDNRLATLKADLAVHTEALAAIRRDVNRVEGGAEDLAEDHSERVLEPVGHEGEIIVLNRKVMSIGRTNDNDIFIPSKLISRHHARLLVGPNAVIVEDAGSTNGCFVNDQQVKQHVLREGDVLAIGDLKFRLGVRSPGDTRMRANVISFSDGRRNSDS